MKITDTAALVAAMRALGKVDKVRSIPVMEAVRVSAAPAAVVFEKSDLDSVVRIEVPAEGDAFEPWLAPHREIAGLIGAAAPWFGAEAARVEHLTMTVADGIYRGNDKEWYKPSDWPDVPFAVGDMEPLFRVPALELRRALAFTGPMICTEGARYYLNGINIVTGDGVRFTSTDGYRLATTLLDGVVPDFAASMILPRTVLKALAALVAKTKEDVAVAVRRQERPLLGSGVVITVVTAIEFSAPGWALRSRVIDGTFPSWERIIPAGIDAMTGNGELAESVTFEGAGLLRAVAMAAAVPGAREHCAIRFDLRAGAVKLSRPTEAGSFEITVPVTDARCKPASSWGVNGKYLLGMLQLLGASGPISFSASEYLHSGPLVLRSEGRQPGSYLILMPMRV